MAVKGLSMIYPQEQAKSMLFSPYHLCVRNTLAFLVLSSDPVLRGAGLWTRDSRFESEEYERESKHYRYA